MIKVSDIITPIIYTENQIKKSVCEKLRVTESDIGEIRIFHRSLLISDKENLRYKFEVLVKLADENGVLTVFKHKPDIVCKFEEFNFEIEKSRLESRPIIVGSGPAGLFAALILAQAGAKPIILERGMEADKRAISINGFFEKGILDTECNIQFGEGGAGTFSDGKLKTGRLNNEKYKILSEFVECGAPEEILYLDKPHIGTDKLLVVLKNIREKIVMLGGEYIFSAKVNEIIIKNDAVCGVNYEKNGIKHELISENVVLAIGHSARDTIEILYNKGIKMEQKSFGVGVRIEHLQEHINKIQYGKFAHEQLLGAASYRLVSHLDNNRSVYSFCMCPGGSVVAATSEKNAVVTNGMSRYMRDGINANCALLVSVNQQDFGSDHPLAGMEYQKKLEKLAYNAGGGGYKAPVQRLEDFMNNQATKAFGEVLPTYPRGVEFVEHDSYLPQYITNSLREAIIDMDNWMSGFYHPDALLTGVETRTTSPIRILRTQTMEASGVSGLYPCGEVGGYAGGIISSAYDGVLAAVKILNK